MTSSKCQKYRNQKGYPYKNKCTDIQNKVCGTKTTIEQRPYTIIENKDGRFSTYVTDSTKPNNRRKIVKASKELLEKEINKFYKELENEKAVL